jgi:hypothetical protein
MGSTRDLPICPASRENRGGQCHLTSLGIAYLGFMISPYHAATVSKNGSSSQIARYTLLLPSLGSFALVNVAFQPTQLCT